MLARLYGKSNIYNFKIEIFGDIKSFDFLKITHHEDGEVLAQVINITRDGPKLIGDCKVVGFKDQGVLKGIRTPFQNDAKVEIADDDFIEYTVGLNKEGEAFIGLLDLHPNLKINLDLKKTITKHIAILAKSGAGKSYTVGVFLEEVMKKNIPIVILDPHNEYASLKYPNTDKKDLERLKKFNLEPMGFLDRIQEYSPDIKTNPQCSPISLDINRLKPQDLVNSLPQKLSPAQQGMIFNILSNLNNRVNFDELIFNISNEESNAKWSLITLLEQLKKLQIYSTNPTPLQDIVKYKKTSIISLKGVEPYVQDTFVAGLLTHLYEARKKEEIPPFLLVLEEGHNFCPERGFGGELKSSKIIRTIAGEGRKFGIGLCVISQRPAKVDKNVVSQCSTQILLKMTNPNDIKSVIASSEGVDSSSDQEIQKLNIGTCLLTGVIDIPLKVNIRPRMTKHGGETIDITLPYEIDDARNNNNLTEENKSFDSKNNENKEVGDNLFSEKNLTNKNSLNNIDNGNNNQSMNKNNSISNSKSNSNKREFSEFVQFVSPEIDIEDAKSMMNKEDVKIQLLPASMIKMKDLQGVSSTILFDRVNKKIVTKLFPYTGEDIRANFTNLSETELKLLKIILTLKDTFNPAELLIKTDVMFNEILRVCDSLASRGFLKKNGREFTINGIKFIKDLSNLNFLGQQKFEEIYYDEKLNEEITEKELKSILENFGQIDNIKEIFIVRYL